MRAVGQISACYQNIRTGEITEVLRQPNLVLYEAADIMAALLGGSSEYAISHMYLQYQNTDSAVSISQTITRANGRPDFSQITGTSPVQDWLRVPIITTPRRSKIPDDTTSYAANAVTFAASSASSSSMAGESPAHNYFAAAGVNGPSKVFSLALVAAPTPADNTRDKIFSRVNLTSALPMQAGHHLTFYWIIKFN